MIQNATFAEVFQVCAGFGPVDMSAAANNGDWVSMKNYNRCAIIVFKAAGTAGDTPTVTLTQATDVSGTSSKALNFTRVDVKSGTLTSVGTYTTVTQSAGNTYAGTANAAGIYIIEIRSEDLDVANGFDCIQASIPDVGANAQLGSCLYVLYGPRYTYGGLKSAIVD